MSVGSRKDEIVLTSLRIISEKGIQSLTLKAIADEMNVTDAAVLKHFKSKDEILAAIVGFFETNFMRIHSEICDSELPVIQKLEKIFEEKCTRISNYPEQIVLMRSYNYFKNNNEIYSKIVSLLNFYKEDLVKIIKKGQKENLLRKDISAEHIYFSLMGALHFLVDKWNFESKSFSLVSEGKKLFKSTMKLIEVAA